MKNGFNLPHDWTLRKLSDVCQRVTKTNSQFENHLAEFTYIDINSIDNTTHKITEPKTLIWKNAPSRAQQRVVHGDTVFSTVRTYMKNIALVNSGYTDAIASTGFCVLRPTEELASKYLFYYTLTDEFLRPLNELQRGTNYPAVRNSDVLDQPIPVPLISEQCRIVSKIEELFSELDAGIASLKAAQKQLHTYRQSVLKHAFEGKFTGGTDVWKKSKLGDIAFVTKLAGFEFTKFVNYTEHGEVPVIRAQNVTKAGFKPGNYHYVTQALKEQLTRSNINGGEILMVFVGAGVGQVALVPENSNFFLGPNVAKIDIDKAQAINLFVLYYLMSMKGQREIFDFQKSTAQGSISMGNIREISLYLPNMGTQNEIVTYLSKVLSQTDALQDTINHQLTTAESLRQSILQRAFSGELV